MKLKVTFSNLMFVNIISVTQKIVTRNCAIVVSQSESRDSPTPRLRK